MMIIYSGALVNHFFIIGFTLNHYYGDYYSMELLLRNLCLIGIIFVVLQTKKDVRAMCTVSVKVNEDVLRGVLPELENTAAIRKWAQKLIDARIRELVEETKSFAIDRDMTPEELFAVIVKDVEEIYANKSL